MTGKLSGFQFPTRWVIHSLFGLTLGTLMLASAPPASAAAIGAQPGVLQALGGPATVLGTEASPNLILAGRRGHRGRRHGGRRFRGHRGRRHKHRRFRGLSIYFGLPYHGYYPRYRYRSYRPYRGGRCARWRRRCAANWGYRTNSYYGCLRYHRCR